MPSAEVLEAQATIQADLAARFWVPCPDCGQSGMELRGSPPQPQGGICSNCHGSGRRYPFQVRCPCDYQDYDRHECWDCYRGGKHYLDGAKLCKRCTGNNFIYAATLDTFCEAFRAKGWKFSVLTGLDNDGDSMYLSERDMGGELVRLEMVGHKDGLTGMAALEMAAWKTLEVTVGQQR